MDLIKPIKNYFLGFVESLTTTTQEAENQPPTVFTIQELTASIHSFTQEKISLSLVNKLFYNQYREVFFFPLLRSLPEVSRQFTNPIPLIKISEVTGQISDAMQLRTVPELARRLASALSLDVSENKKELFDDALSMLESLAQEGCPTAQFELGKLYYQGGVGVEKDHEKAISWLLKVAHHSSEACTYLADMTMSFDRKTYFERPRPVNYQMVNKWLEDAIKLNPSNGDAYFLLGRMLIGDILWHEKPEEFYYLFQQKNKYKGASFIQKAAELGCVGARVRFGEIVANDMSTPWYQVEVAYEWLLESSRGNENADSVFSRLKSNIFFGSYDFQRDAVPLPRHMSISSVTDAIHFQEPAASSLYLKGLQNSRSVYGENEFYHAAKAGHIKALFKLIDCYIHENLFEKEWLRTAKVVNFILTSLEKCINAGHPEALYKLGVICLQQGKQEKANQCFEQAVITNQHPEALKNVGPAMRFRAGEHLENAEYLKALEIYAAFAKAGDADAKQKIVFMVTGKLISELDDELFLLCFEHEANQGDGHAAFELAKRYINGFYLSKSAALEAQKWLKIAVDKKIENAQEKLNEVNTKLESWFLF